MAAAKKKRGADNYLTDQNWDREDDQEPEVRNMLKSLLTWI